MYPILALLACAQAATPMNAPAREAYLAARVTEELQREGDRLGPLRVSLTLHGYAGHIRIYEAATGVTRRTRIVNSLPDDREAAVATLTLAASAELAAITNTPSPAVRPAPTSMGEALSEFRERAIHWERITSEASLHTTWYPVQGESRITLTRLGLYRAVGRLDLVAQYQRNERRNMAIAAGGVVIGIVAPLVYYGVRQDVTTTEGAVMGGAAIVGLSMMLGAMLASPDPLTTNEAKQLTETYNRTLRRSLGVPSAQLPAAPVYLGYATSF